MTYKEAIAVLAECRYCKEKGADGECLVDSGCFDAKRIAIEALEKLIEITEILDDTDYHNAESINEIGEDKGYLESICAISVAVDGRYRWME